MTTNETPAERLARIAGAGMFSASTPVAPAPIEAGESYEYRHLFAAADHMRREERHLYADQIMLAADELTRLRRIVAEQEEREAEVIEAGEREALIIAMRGGDSGIHSIETLADRALAGGFRRAPVEAGEREAWANWSEQSEPGSDWESFRAGYRAALRAPIEDAEPCPTCSGPIRETTNLVCQMCGTDYGREDAEPVAYAILCEDDSIMGVTMMTLADARDAWPTRRIVPLYRHPAAPIEVTQEMAWRAAHAMAEWRKRVTGAPALVAVDQARTGLNAALKEMNRRG